MPMSASFSLATWIARRRSKMRNTPQTVRVGSRPMKKLRHTRMSGTSARSRETVAMPRSSASGGESKATGAPSTRYVPALGGCTPARILISVDLPAPLSPSRQWTSPRRSWRLTSWRAATVPKTLLTPSSSRRCSAGAMSPRSRDAAAHVVVEQHGDEQHQAQEHAEPVRIDVGVGDADLHDAEDQRAEAGADHRAVAAGEQAPADHRGDDGLELLLQTAVGGG